MDSPLSILIVDPDSAVAETVDELLEDSRYRVVRVSTFDEARGQLATQVFTVVLVDGRLEGLVRTETPSAALIPMLGAADDGDGANHGSHVDGKDAMDRGPVVLIKPFGKRELLDAIERVVRQLAAEESSDPVPQRLG